MQNKLRETVCIFFLHKHASLNKYMHFLRPKYCVSPERSVIGCAFSTLEVNFISRDFKSRSVFSVPIMIGIHDLTVYAITAEGGLCARHMTWKFVKMFHISSRRYWFQKIMFKQTIITQSMLPTPHGEKCFTASWMGGAGLITRRYTKNITVVGGWATVLVSMITINLWNPNVRFAC